MATLDLDDPLDEPWELTVRVGGAAYAVREPSVSELYRIGRVAMGEPASMAWAGPLAASLFDPSSTPPPLSDGQAFEVLLAAMEQMAGRHHRHCRLRRADPSPATAAADRPPLPVGCLGPTNGDGVGGVARELSN